VVIGYGASDMPNYYYCGSGIVSCGVKCVTYNNVFFVQLVGITWLRSAI
jgi:hypothetical protein